ncbi:hypothetical protein BS50DRAFT_573764 [Corynespora cassiicola Philippines]|uniref:RRM domain-containing protein n=1 Tax=Corynespora cassiicola Philippines TaxID=1448308 RepID=A0A2T2NNH2_CORCC|nr:hypothetical protein BS50DRAFT_573764 [Corynespora cassiicola Philippines]
MADSSFANFVKDARERKKKEALAQEILGSRGRKANSGSGAGALTNARNKAPQKPTLMSRISGVQKPRSASAKPAGNIDGKWQHDLHNLSNRTGPAPKKRLNRTVSASQVERNSRTYDKFAGIINDKDDSAEFSIRGVATGGPCVVIASNFAPGTTSADIEAVMAPHGGDLLNCRLVASNPTVMCELTFATREGANNVIATFNNKKADGRLLYVYLKDTPNNTNNNGKNGKNAPRAQPTRYAAQSYDDMDVDMDVDTNGGAPSGGFQNGRLGFNDNSRRGPPRGPRRR